MDLSHLLSSAAAVAMLDGPAQSTGALEGGAA